MNRQRNALVILLTLCVLGAGETQSQDLYTFVYDPATGGFSLDFSDSLPTLTTLELTSSEGFFSGQRPDALNGLFDVFREDKLFKLEPGGFGPTDFGQAMASGLTTDEIIADLCVRGSRLGGGGLGAVQLATIDGGIPFQDCFILPPAFPNDYRFEYIPETGELTFVVPDSKTAVTTLQIKSTSGVFTGARPDAQLPGQFDVFRPDKLFKLDPNGFLTTGFGPVVTPNLTEAMLVEDFCVQGTHLPRGRIDAIYLGNSLLSDCIEPPPPPAPPADPVALSYDLLTRELKVEVRDDSTLSTLLINSNSAQFQGERPAVLSGEFDVFRPDRIFKFDPNGFGDLELGVVFPEGRSTAGLANDLCITGSFLDGGDIGEIRINGRSMSRCDEPQFDVRPLPPPGGVMGLATLIYSPATGDLHLVTRNREITTIEIISADRLFQGDRPPELDGLFDVYNAGKIFKLDPAGFGDLFFPAALPPDLSFAELAQDLTINGSVVGGGALDATLQYEFIPEPRSSLLAIFGVIGIGLVRRANRFESRRSPFGRKGREGAA